MPMFLQASMFFSGWRKRTLKRLDNQLNSGIVNTEITVFHKKYYYLKYYLQLRIIKRQKRIRFFKT